MKIKELAIDRYGAWSKLRLADLDDRLNVIYGVNGSGKTTVVRFLQAMLYGFPHFQESAAPAQSSPWGGSITVEGPHGRCVIRRHDNGTRLGRLSLHAKDGSAIDRDVLPEMLSGVDETVYRLMFQASFRDAPPTEMLVQTALAHGFDLAETREAPAWPSEEPDRVRRLEENRREFDRVTARRTSIDAELDDLERERLQLRHRRDDELRRLNDEIDRNEAELARLRRELQILDDEIAAWEERRAAQSVVSFAALDEEELEDQTLQRRLAAVQSQLERWRKVQHDVQRRRTRLRREMLSWTRPAGETPLALWDDAQKHIDAIERRLEQLQGEIRVLADPPASENCNCREADRRCSPLVRAIRDDVYHLCRELNRYYLDERRQSITEELRQLRRCHFEVGAHMQRLAKHRQRLEQELAAQNAAIAPVRLRRQQTADLIRQCEAQLARLHDERRAWERLPSSAEKEAAIEARRRELEVLKRELDDRLAQLGAAIRADAAWRPREPEPVTTAGAVAQDASEYLRRLTDGQFRRVRIWRNDRKVGVEDAHGELYLWDAHGALRPASAHAKGIDPRKDSLAWGRSVRDRLHLALCLALVGGYARRGVHLPLILDDAFINLEASQAEQLGQLLREFAGRGHQAFVFTCREQVARMFRRLDVPVLELPAESNLYEQQAVRWSPEPRLGVAMQTIAAVPEPIAHLDDDLAPPLNDRPLPERREEDRRPRHYLQRSDAIQYAPDIDRLAAQELAVQGTTTVGDLLALSPVVVEQRLAHLNIAAETVRQWQAMARLMCDTPHLRAYDARMLVASGIESSDELERLTPEELLQRVERCLDSDRGRTLFRMGDDDELARLASWIGSGRATQTLRETQMRHWTRRRRGGRGRRWYDDAHRQEYAPARNGAATTLLPDESPLVVERTPRPLLAERHPPRRRFYLELSSPVVDAPSIGPRTAERLRAIGVQTVADLLTVSPESAARRMGVSYITAQTVRDWQAQAELVCSTPDLRAHDAQILVGCGITTPERLAASEPMRLFELVEPFSVSDEGQRILRNGRRPDLAEVTHWIASAQHARKLHAA